MGLGGQETGRSPRIRLRTRPHTMPLVHPSQVRKRPKLFTTVEEYWEKAGDIPVEDGGLYAAEDDARVTDEGARKEADMILRIEREAEFGGILSTERCSAFVPEHEEEPPRQWAHMDHLVKACANFRRLLLGEQVRHRTAAKKLAEACRDEWVRRQPKSAEQLEAEARELWIARYRVVVKALFGTWENVKVEINKRRLEEWEAEEQRRVKAALNKAVNISEQKLQARQAHFDSDLDDEDEDEDDMELDSMLDTGDAVGTPALFEDRASGEEGDSEADEDEDEDAEDEDEDDDNMSSSSLDEEEAGRVKDETGDENLTREQLLAKYANLPDVEFAETREGAEVEGNEQDADDTSDESVDMDDDLGSTDMDSEDEDDEGGSGEEEEESDEDEGTGGLLGLFFGKTELQQMTAESAESEEGNGDAITTVQATENDKTREPRRPDVKIVTSNGVPKINGIMPESGDATENDDHRPGFETDEDEVSLIQHPGICPDTTISEEQTSEEVAAEARTPDTQLPTKLAGLKTKSLLATTLPAGAAMDVDDLPAVPDAKLSNGNGLSHSHASPDSREESNHNEINGISSHNEVAVGDQDTSDVARKERDGAQTTPMEVTGDQGTSEDVMMAEEAPAKTESAAVTTQYSTSAPAGNHSPETDPNTDGRSPRSQSPRTSDTKPSEVSASASEAAAVQVEEHVQISRSSSPPTTGGKTEIPFLLRGTLREYQHYGLDWLAGLYANGTNGILADEMGLGKTIQTIALLAHLACHHEVWGPHLVIVPTSVMLNWEMEFKKWCPGFKILAYYGTQDERKRKRQGWNNDDVWNVCVTSYQLVLQDHQVFKRRRWHYMILDEAHNIKNFKSQRWQTLLGFNTHSRLLLTGTPLQNNLTELWSLLFFLMPGENGAGGFADLQEFHDWFHKPESQILESGKEKMDDEARAIIAKLHKLLRPYLLRRLKADVEKQMPAKYEHVEMCRLSKRQRELYDGFLARTDTRTTLSSGNYLSIINCLMQLRKVCNHPDLFVDRPIMTSFPMAKSVPGEYEATERLVRKTILAEKPMGTVDFRFLNLVPAAHEHISTHTADTIFQLSSHRRMMDLKEVQRVRAKVGFKSLDPSTVNSNITYLESKGRWGRFEELQHCVYLNALRRQQRPVYGSNLVKLVTLDLHNSPRKLRSKSTRSVLRWDEEDSKFIRAVVKGVYERSAEYQTTIEKFACTTPAVVAKDLQRIILGPRAVQAFRDENMKLSKTTKWAPFMPPAPTVDPWHEARMRLSIQFPDKRLLQWDCGKLQTLDRLLRKLQAGGHRALIFTQMTKVLDILELFLNIHGHKYLRLDGATKVEQRQILTDRFNNDTRILCFILSTRSGGLGINLTGADTVIFYDQDWNPAMDKQCQDRCHRIGQTRDVHIYRLVSEHTIEANILRKATQKQMLDDAVIQEGEFTTDYFNKLTVRDVIDDAELVTDDMAAANAAMDRVLGGVDSGASERNVSRVLEQAEDKEDVTAARAAEREIQTDDADFQEKAAVSVSGSGPPTERQNTPREDVRTPVTEAGGESSLAEVDLVERNAWKEPVRNIDEYMLRSMAAQLAGTPLELPKDKKKSKKKGKDMRKR